MKHWLYDILRYMLNKFALLLPSIHWKLPLVMSLSGLNYRFYHFNHSLAYTLNFFLLSPLEGQISTMFKSYHSVPTSGLHPCRLSYLTLGHKDPMLTSFILNSWSLTSVRLSVVLCNHARLPWFISPLDPLDDSFIFSLTPHVFFLSSVSADEFAAYFTTSIGDISKELPWAPLGYLATYLLLCPATAHCLYSGYTPILLAVALPCPCALAPVLFPSPCHSVIPATSSSHSLLSHQFFF